MSQLRFFFKYFCHFFSARHSKGFSVHSPLIYHFTRFVLYVNHPYYFYQRIENIRDSLLKNKHSVDITDFGTGGNRIETISKIASNSLKSPKYAQLLYRIVNFYKARNIIELGTSLGVTSSYLASSSSDIHCVSMEGCPQIAAIAKVNIDSLGLHNVDIVIGNIDDNLSQVLDQMYALDLVFFDANHKSTAILSYFEMCLTKIHQNTVFVIDDIYWSNDMEFAWETIKNHPSVYSTIDLFHSGIVFFDAQLSKTHYKMRF